MSAPETRINLAVVGAHLRGQPLNHQLTELGAEFVRSALTAPLYRLYALQGAEPPKPGLLRLGQGEGAEIRMEVWGLTAESFGAFVEKVPAPLCIGTIELKGGESVKGFLCEPHVIPAARDITEFGGWLDYLDSA
jgi:allophanate hydrolase